MKEELYALKKILISCGLSETIKWTKSCFMYGSANIAIVYQLKTYCAIGFLKGALLEDPNKILIKPGENSQAGRWMKFRDMSEIWELEDVLRAYILEAIEIEKAGLKIEFKKTEDFKVPKELQEVFAHDLALKHAFESLTPGRQRGYLLHFAQAKQSATRYSRIENHRQRILALKGLQDCVCGLSKRFPRCDGSHKHQD